MTSVYFHDEIQIMNLVGCHMDFLWQRCRRSDTPFLLCLIGGEDCSLSHTEDVYLDHLIAGVSGRPLRSQVPSSVIHKHFVGRCFEIM